MAYKISNRAVIVNEGGEKVLIADELQYEDSITISSTTNTLPPTYITDYFAVATPYHNQGSTSGYNSGGGPPFLGSLTGQNNITKFPFATDANASDVGDLTQNRAFISGNSSDASGYASGGRGPNGNEVNTIDKFPFSADTNAADVGDLTQARNNSKTGNSSTASGYASGGDQTNDTIDKFPFASDANATDVGDLAEGRNAAAGQNSTTHGYVSGGGGPASTEHMTIQKFPFATDTNATLTSQLLTMEKDQMAGQNSNTHGYVSGGRGPFSSDTFLSTIEKFSFSSDASAREIGDLTQARSQAAGQSSTANGYTSGGFFSPPDPGDKNTIDKFPFATDANASDVGDLGQGRRTQAGQQV